MQIPSFNEFKKGIKIPIQTPRGQISLWIVNWKRGNGNHKKNHLKITGMTREKIKPGEQCEVKFKGGNAFGIFSKTSAQKDGLYLATFETIIAEDEFWK